MFTRYVCVSFFWVFLSTFSLPSSLAHAQTSAPLPDGSSNWCTAISGGGKSCTSSPHSSCEIQWNNFGAAGTLLGQTKQDDEYWYAQNCYWTNHIDDNGPVTSLPGNVYFECPYPYKRIGTAKSVQYCVLVESQLRDEPCSKDGTNPAVGNPISVITGGKHQRVVDYASPDGLFRIERNFTTRAYGKSAGISSDIRGHGYHWRFEAELELGLARIFSSSKDFTIFTPEGTAFDFSDVAANGTTTASTAYSYNGVPVGWSVQMLNPPANLADVPDQQTDWEVTDDRGVVYEMRSVKDHPNAVKYWTARPIKITYPGGYEQTLTYGTYGELLTRSDNLGRTATYEWLFYQLGTEDTSGNITPLQIDGVDVLPEPVGIEKITLNDGTVIRYTYDYGAPVPPGYLFTTTNLLDRLTDVERESDNQIKFEETYHYEDTDLPYHLTGITDSNGVRYATWAYDTDGRATLSEHAGGVDKTTISYGTKSGYYVENRVTNALGKDTVYKLYEDLQRKGLSEINGQASANCVGDTQKFQYGPWFRDYPSWPLTQTTDKEGRITRYERDTLGRITKTTLAYGTSDQAVIDTQWHSTYLGYPTQVAAPDVTTDYTYDSDGHLTAVSLQDNATSQSRTWTMTYGSGDIYPGSVDGPGTGDTTTYTYSGTRQDLATVTNPVGHVTTYSNYTPRGAPGQITDPNGVITALTYDSLDRVISATLDSGGFEQTTLSFGYDDVGNLTSFTPANGAALTFTYDNARRLTRIENAAGEKIDLTRNLMGAVTQTDFSSSSAGLRFEITTAVDELNRVIERSVGPQPATTIGYDKEDNPVTLTDPRGGGWTRSFDSLNRLKSEIDPLSAQTTLDVDPQALVRNPLDGVTDARGITTTYVRNGFGDVLQEISQEAGTTSYTYDARGLVTQKTDARGVVSDYTYDAAGRLLTVAYPSSSADNITYEYDQGTNGKGRLTKITEGFGTTSFTYDALGRLTQEVRTINGVSYTTAYTYNSGFDVMQVTYPSGRTVQVDRDAAARISAIRTRPSGGSGFTDLLTNIAYEPFGPIKSADFGDGHLLTIDYDTAYRATRLKRDRAGSPTLMDISFTYDAAGDILTMNDAATPARNQTFTYDAVSRLTSADGAYGDIDYTYNSGGDRTVRAWTQSGSTVTETYTYNSDAQLTGITVAGQPARSLTYAASGQAITDIRGGHTYDYNLNARGRIASVDKGGAQIAAYTYDAAQQRIVKTVGTTTRPLHL